MSKTSAKVENVTNDNLSRNNLTSWENGKKNLMKDVKRKKQEENLKRALVVPKEGRNRRRSY